MHVEHHILDEAAKQLRETIGTALPMYPPGWTVEDNRMLREVLEEVHWGDLMVTVRAAAERLPEPDGED